MRTIKTLFMLVALSICSWQSAWADDEELTVSVTLLEPGSLGSEILAAPGVDHIKNVVNLTVCGTMNDDDWATIKLIEELKTLDLENAEITCIPREQFSCWGSPNSPNLVSIKLPNTITTVGDGAFNQHPNLQTINWPTSATIIPENCFYSCVKLEPFEIPEGVVSIGQRAFSGCNKFKTTIPSTIQSIGNSAFEYNSMEGIDVVIPEGANVSTNVFRHTKLSSITYPSTEYAPNQLGAIDSDELIITFKSPTVVDPQLHEFFYDYNSTYPPQLTIANITLRVPSHLVNSYKLHPVWGKCKDVIGFSILDVTDVSVWPIQTTFNMTNSIRMEGTPSVKLNHNAILSISGNMAQNFGDFSFCNAYIYDDHIYKYYNKPSLILSTCDNVRVTGTMVYQVETNSKTWYFLSMPFDFSVGDIITENGVKYAIRYYDGASRAENDNATGNWKNLSNNTIVKAGQGFILQTSQKTWVTFSAQQNDSRNNVLSNSEISVPLDANATSDPAHRGWNLVGNPWQCYYNIHKLNYSAPISVYDNSNYTYVAYSLQDDDYALLPNQAFFVQCPDAVSTIGFPVDGRQLTDEITEQNAARMKDNNRKLIDVVLSYGEMKDRTRVVVNPYASMDYETSCDASKFFSMNDGVPQIYSLLSDGTEMAINERPVADGMVKLGLLLPESGMFTISAPRNGLSSALLIDHLTGSETDLAIADYTFSAEAGTNESRFELRLGGAVIDNIQSVTKSVQLTPKLFDLQGRPVSHPEKGLYIMNGKKTVVK